MTRRSKAEWLKLIEEHQASSLSAAEFCRQKGLNAKYFSLRRRELAETKSSFVAVSAPTMNSSGNRVDVRVVEFSVSMSELQTLLS